MNKPTFPSFDHPLNMKNNKVPFDGDLGLIRIVGYFLQVKVYGDDTSLTENQLREKFERLITHTNIGDGAQRIKVSELSIIFEASSNVEADERRPETKFRSKATKPKRRKK